MSSIITIKNKASGFTLIELMIAVVISSILMLGVIQIFGANKRSHVVGSGLARVQENIRFAVKEISYATRMAGYSGCSGKITNHLDPTGVGYSDDLFDFETATGGWEFTNASATSATEPGQSYTITSLVPDATESKWDNIDGDDLPATLDNKVLPGTDILVLKWAGNQTGVTLKNMNKNNASINTNSASGIAQGTIVVVSDCSGGDAFMNTANSSASALAKGVAGGHAPGNKNNASSKWSHVYPGSADFLYFISRAYYIGVGASGEPALFRITYSQGASGQATDEIAEGIENMQVLFGVDTDADGIANRFVTARDVTLHKDVVSLKIALLARTPDEVKKTSSSSTYTMLGTSVTSPDDRRIRYLFTTTVKIRNKGKK